MLMIVPGMKKGEILRAPPAEIVVGILDHRKTTDARTDVDTDPVGIGLSLRGRNRGTPGMPAASP